jgi:hypothetical protein
MRDGLRDAYDRNVVGLLEYLSWRESYEKSDKSGKLGFLFCMAFDVDNPGIRETEDDLTADSLIRRKYCYDDFVTETDRDYEDESVHLGRGSRVWNAPEEHARLRDSESDD